MIISEFNHNHIEEAAKLALNEYHEERTVVNILPDEDYYNLFCDMLSKLIDNSLGVVTIEDNKVKGFISCYNPIDKLFGTSLGVFSPIHAHGTIKENRGRIYSQLYQTAAKKWVEQGILSHAIALYSHDKTSIDSFFWNGFGLRCIDAIREVESIPSNPKCNYFELTNTDLKDIVEMENDLVSHLRNTPMFMARTPNHTLESLLKEKTDEDSRFFGAKLDDKLIGFIKISNSGENFACNNAKMKNICGAYLIPEYRGNGIYQGLLSYLMDVLINEGYSRCGVDFESFNPTAKGFWLKHFTPYTYSVTRRIDERILK